MSKTNTSPVKKQDKDLWVDVSEFFREFAEPLLAKETHCNWKPFKKFPKINVYRETKSVVIELALPGYDDEDVVVNLVDNNLLVIKGTKKKKTKAKSREYFREEYCVEVFEESFEIPQNVVLGKYKRTTKNGELVIKLPIIQGRKSKWTV